ncbi:hypothetical protein M899_1385 [Bacteriovorax sp. BSW11_IV]|nr:hypothetical protein M899_1385 [Bacteriovorax sp. BSW11_IV]
MSSNSYSFEVEIKKGLPWNKISVNKDMAHIKGAEVNMKIDSTDCSRDLVEEFEGKLESSFQNSPKVLATKEAEIIYVIEGKEYQATRKSPLGQFLIQQPRIFQSMKVKEKFRKCL